MTPSERARDALRLAAVTAFVGLVLAAGYLQSLLQRGYVFGALGVGIAALWCTAAALRRLRKWGRR